MKRRHRHALATQGNRTPRRYLEHIHRLQQTIREQQAVIEILKRGTPPQDKLATVNCGRCKSTLRLARRDGELILDQREGDAVKIACPVCQSEIWVATGLFTESPTAFSMVDDRSPRG